MREIAQRPMPAALQGAAGEPMPKDHGLALRRQDGAIAIMLAVLLPVILGFIALALELGRLYNRKIEMQAVADNLAISAASKLNGTEAGISDALTAAHNVLEEVEGRADTKPRYQYHHTMVFTEKAIRFASSPDGTAGWLDSDAAKKSPAGLAFVKVDTTELDAAYGRVDLLFMRILSNVTAMQIPHTTVAGRQRIKLTPIAICAMSKDPSNPFKERVNTGGNAELTEFGFRRGVSYNLLQLSPHTQKAVNYLVDPINLSPKAGNFTVAKVGPYVCTGTVELPRVIGQQLNLQSDFPIGSLFNQLNSRFNLPTTSARCDAAAAPPDANVKQFAFGSLDWMTKPHDQAADPAPTLNRMETVADLDPLNDTDPTHYGPLWVFARPVPWSSYVPGKAEPAGGYAPFEPSKAVWDALYGAGSALKAASYPTGTTPYFSQVGSPGTNWPGTKYRRVLNVPLLDCPAGSAPGKVLAIGRFFMTVPATDKAIFAEFAGATLTEELSAPVELF